MRISSSFLAATAIVAMLAACSAKPGDSATAAAAGEAGAPTAPEASKASIEQRDLASLGDTAPGVVYGFDADQLGSISTPMHCSLDSVNHGAPGSAPLPANSIAMLSGWLDLGAAGEAPGVYAVLDGTKDFAFRAIVGDARPDLTAKLEAGAIADFTASVDLTDVPAGDYQLYFVRAGSQGPAKCVADSRISIQ